MFKAELYIKTTCISSKLAEEFLVLNRAVFSYIADASPNFNIREFEIVHYFIHFVRRTHKYISSIKLLCKQNFHIQNVYYVGRVAQSV